MKSRNKIRNRARPAAGDQDEEEGKGCVVEEEDGLENFKEEEEEKKGADQEARQS